LSRKRLIQADTSIQPESLTNGDKVVASVGGELEMVDNNSTSQVKDASTDLNNSFCGQVNAAVISADNSLIGIIHSNAISLKDSLIGIASSQKPTLQGVIGVSLGQDTVLNDTRTGLVVAQEVRSDHIQTVLLIANHVDGPVEVLADHRSIAIFGIAVGFSLGLIFSLFRLFRGR